jgi:outer membrane protein assembly factor BamA
LKLSGNWETADFVYRDFDYINWDLRARLRWNFLGPLFVAVQSGYGYFDQQGVFSGSTLYMNPAKRRHVAHALTVGMDSRDLRWYPTRGAYHRLSVEYVNGRNFKSYTRLTGDLRQFIPTPWDHILALRAWGRLVDNHVPPEDMLYWGGPNTIRGYGYATVEGEEGFLLTAEYRWPLFLMPISAEGHVIGIGLHAFTDAGTTWLDGETKEPLYGFGAGFHINVAVHQFRFEMAKSKNGSTTFQFMDSFNF